MNARDYLALLRERMLLIGACVVMGLVLATIVTVVMPKSYASSVTFYIVADTSPGQNQASDNYQGAQLSTARVKSYAELLTGPRVAADAAAQLGGTTTPSDVMAAVSATSVADTVILTMTATGPSPERATAIAGAVSSSFTRLIRQLETSGTSAQEIPSVPVNSTGGVAVTTPAVSAQVLQPPSVPESPVRPSLSLNLIIGLVLGLLIGFGAAVVRHALDVSVRTARDLYDSTGAPVLGAVPEDKETAAHPVSLTADADGACRERAEAYRRIRTAVEASNDGGHRRVLVVTSPLAGDGRTTTACNLAVSLAAVGARVVLVDGDLRTPRVSELLGLDDAPGLTSVLTDHTPLGKALQQWAPEEVSVLTSGPGTSRPNELLASRRTGDVVADLRARFDYVIIDAPPVLGLADAANLAAHADGVIMVCRWGSSKRPEIESAVSFLQSVSVPVVGTVLARVPRSRRAGDITPLDLGRRAVVGGPDRRPAVDDGPGRPASRTPDPVTTAGVAPDAAPARAPRRKAGTSAAAAAESPTVKLTATEPAAAAPPATDAPAAGKAARPRQRRTSVTK